MSPVSLLRCSNSHNFLFYGERCPPILIYFTSLSLQNKLSSLPLCVVTSFRASCHSFLTSPKGSFRGDIDNHGALFSLFPLGEARGSLFFPLQQLSSPYLLIPLRSGPDLVVFLDILWNGKN